MARIVSPVWSSARGSICGTTYLTTASGQIIARQRTRPTQTPTNYRTYIKNAMQMRATHWNALTVAQRSAWDVWAMAQGLPTGRQAYLQGTVLPQFILNAGLIVGLTGLRDDAPDTNFHPNVQCGATSPVAAGTDAVAFKVQNNGGQRVVYLLELSPGLNPARNYWKGPWNTTRSLSATVNSGVTAVVEFPLLNVGEKYFVRCRVFTCDVTLGLRGNVVQAVVYANSIAVHVP